MRKILLIISILIVLGIFFIGFNNGLFSKSKIIEEQLQNYSYTVELAFPNLSFSNPVGIYSPHDGTDRLFILEQEGQVIIFNNSRDVTKTEVFLDISDKILYGGEQGLLGLAFHPNFSMNGYFYLDYTMDDPRRTVIAQYSVFAENPNQANKNSEVIILEIEQPYSNHNGGQIAFNPSDNYLYIAMGDGGSSGDPLNNAQNLSSLLGAILRIDIDDKTDELNYAIPLDNPFVGNTQGYREEIFAYGLRNPWRFSFDTSTEWLWVADVGQNRIEEIDIIEKGKNYGWRIMEGSECYNPSTDCNTTGLTYPIYEYGHDLGNSITGGFVYRGSDLKVIYDYYIYADFGSGRIWALNYNNSSVENYLLVDSSLNIASFGTDTENELYFCAFDGNIYKLNETLNTTNNTSSLAISSELSSNGKLKENTNLTGWVTLLSLVIVALVIPRKRKKS